MSSPHTSIADLRKSYERAELNEDASHAAPLQQFDQWLQEAIRSQVPEPNAMTVATVGCDLRPSTRVVLIKGFDERGIVWYTNYESRKGRQLAGNPFAALQFHWVELERVVRNRQIRIEFFADSGSAARQRALARFGALMMFLLFALIAVLSTRVVYDDIRFGETSPGIGVPQWWYTIWLPVMSVAISGRALGLFIRRGRRA